jgi:thiamine-monophosphate kinase
MTAIALGQGPEFDRIRAIAERLGSRAGVLGDDCALIEIGETFLALSTDVSVEGVHFRREWLSLEEIGWRATAAALSDLAAAGASAVGVLAALTVPAAEPAATFSALMDGAGNAVASVGGVVLGGDLSRGPLLSLAMTVVGRTTLPAHRHGARPGDSLWVTGALGGARAALLAWQNGRRPAEGARARFAHPEPRLDQGAWLVAQGARAMLDLSDGLAADAGHLAAASGVSVRIDLNRVPADPAGLEEAERSGESPGTFAARGGEDYELLVAMPAEFTGTGAVGLTRIGEVQPGSGARFLLDGAEQRLAGFDHFA